MEAFTGTVKGYRRAHGRGLVFRGTFTPSAEARGLTIAEHFQGPTTPVVVRLSNASGSPYAPDLVSRKVGKVLGLGVRFDLESKGHASWAAANIAAFVARTPEDFIGITKAQEPTGKSGQPNIFRVLAHVVTHLNVLGALKSILAIAPAPSFANVRFNSVHAYYLVDATGQRKAFRYSWVPVDGTATLSKSEADARPLQYLLDEARERVARAPIAWDLVFQLANPGDPLDDATKIWPADRATVVAGRLVVDRLHEDQKEAETLVFDPTGVVPGIELSDDPILHFRSRVYSESYARRTRETRPDAAPKDMLQ